MNSGRCNWAWASDTLPFVNNQFTFQLWLIRLIFPIYSFFHIHYCYYYYSCVFFSSPQRTLKVLMDVNKHRITICSCTFINFIARLDAPATRCLAGHIGLSFLSHSHPGHKYKFKNDAAACYSPYFIFWLNYYHTMAGAINCSLPPTTTNMTDSLLCVNAYNQSVWIIWPLLHYFL